jgi:hypothetical protein
MTITPKTLKIETFLKIIEGIIIKNKMMDRKKKYLDVSVSSFK